LLWPPAPTKSPLSVALVDSGKTSPTSGRAPTVPDFGAGSATGAAAAATAASAQRFARVLLLSLINPLMFAPF